METRRRHRIASAVAGAVGLFGPAVAIAVLAAATEARAGGDEKFAAAPVGKSAARALVPVGSGFAAAYSVTKRDHALE